VRRHREHQVIDEVLSDTSVTLRERGSASALEGRLTSRRGKVEYS
jgi:hypothetical protein